jgi:hypothetical protein
MGLGEQEGRCGAASTGREARAILRYRHSGESLANGLPLSLAALGAPGCNLLTSFPVTLATPTDVTGDAILTLALPANPAFLGFQLFNQWFVLDPPANVFDITVSNGGKATVGA